MVTLTQAILEAAIDLRNKQNGIGEKDLETAIETVMESGGSTDSPGSFQNLQQFQKEEDGRTWNNTQVLYILPSDKPEWVRLDKQHVAICLGLGGLNPCPELIEAILKPEPGINKSILDLGCGTGIWSFEMARAFPSARVVGLDLVPIPLEPEKLPINFEMVVGDINTELPRFQGQFDLVYMRFIFVGVTDIRKTIREAQQCLKPGGLLLSITPDMRILDSDQNTVIPIATDENPEGSWLERMQRELKSAARLNGTDKLAHGEFLDGGFWDDELMDTDTCGSGNLFLPMSPWTTSSDPEEDVRMKLIGFIMKQNYMDMQHFWVPVLKKFGWEQEELERWSALTDEEMIGNKFKSWLRIRMAWGRRRVMPNQKQSPNPTQHAYKSLSLHLISDQPRNSIGSASLEPPHPAQEDGTRTYSRIEVYTTKEESVKRALAIIDSNPPIATPTGSQTPRQ